ncbi:MAG TPA: metallophosphoesterase [Anaerolineae bacterium]|nr:metallophosphoesterase [Anaerolineae bacterium]
MNYIEASFVDTVHIIIAILSRVTALPLLGLSLSSSTVNGWLWGRAARKASVGWGVFFATLSFSALDLALLKSLPVLGLSFGPSRVTFIVMLVTRSAVTITLALSFGLALAWRRRRKSRVNPRQAVAPCLNVFFGVQLFLSLCAVDGFLIEPFSIQVTHHEFSFDRLPAEGLPLRIVHLSDPHVERTTVRERKLVSLVDELEPDLILLTGDYLNLSYLGDETALRDFRPLASQWQAPYGVYAVRGSVDSPTLTEQLFAGLDIVVLENESVRLDVEGQEIYLVGVACSHDLSIDIPRLDQALSGVPPDSFKILLYHSPDLIEAASERGIDLYLAGHTHGGQIRLPLYGAVATSSIYYKQYEAGLFQVGQTYLYVSRGLGLEGASAPRARFLCRPEVAVHTLRGRD